MERKSHHELGYGNLRISSGPKCQGIPTIAGAIGPHFKNRPFTFVSLEGLWKVFFPLISQEKVLELFFFF